MRGRGVRFDDAFGQQLDPRRAHLERGHVGGGQPRVNASALPASDEIRLQSW